MSALPSPALRSLYRRILRELPTRSMQLHGSSGKTTILSHQSPLQRRIRSSLSTNPRASSSSSSDSPAATTSQIQEAEQFIQYVQAQRMYATLMERYNPGMNMNEEERVRLSARRVGMNLPVEFQTENKS